MKFKCDFTHRHYLEVLDFLKKTHKIGPIKDFQRLKKNKKFVLLRHDVDFSLEYALELAKIESKNNLFSTYFVLLHSPYYNALSPENISRIQKIQKLGHEIGLHYDLDLLLDGKIEIIKNEINTLSNICGKKIYSIAPHNVATSSIKKVFLKKQIDAYYIGKQKEIEYISDSVQNWRNGCMCNHVLKNKLQILTHPLWWNNKNLRRENNYKKFKTKLLTEANEQVSKLKTYHKLYFKKIKKS